MDVREKLVELLCKSGSMKCDSPTGECTNCLKLADHLIANGVTVQEWIPVTERLPEQWLNVLALRMDGKIRVDFICSTGCWSEDFDYVGEPVTHWMPMPQPPKGE